VDILLCRNTLMYFNLETQARVLARLHFALDRRGILFLGRAEMLLSHSDAFVPVDLRHRVFSRRSSEGMPVRVVAPQAALPRRRDDDLARTARLREAALDASPVGQVVLDPHGRVAVINHRATLMFHL